MDHIQHLPKFFKTTIKNVKPFLALELLLVDSTPITYCFFISENKQSKVAQSDDNIKEETKQKNSISLLRNSFFLSCTAAGGGGGAWKQKLFPRHKSDILDVPFQYPRCINRRSQPSDTYNHHIQKLFEGTILEVTHRYMPYTSNQNSHHFQFWKEINHSTVFQMGFHSILAFCEVLLVLEIVTLKKNSFSLNFAHWKRAHSAGRWPKISISSFLSASPLR